MTSIICLFELLRLNDLLLNDLVDDVVKEVEVKEADVKEVDVKETLKSWIFIMQNGVEFRQGSIGTIRCI